MYICSVTSHPGVLSLSGLAHVGGGCWVSMVQRLISPLFQMGNDQRHMVGTPDWEKEVPFHLGRASWKTRICGRWINLDMETLQPPLTWGPSAEIIWLDPTVEFDLETMPLRDPGFFKAGQLHDNGGELNYLFEQLSRVREWIHEGVYIGTFYQHYRCNFKGKSYDSSTVIGQVEKK